MEPQSASNEPRPNTSASRSAPPSTRPQRGQPGHARPTHRPLGRPGTRTGRPARHFGRPSHPPRRGKARVEHQSPAQRKQTGGPIPPPAPDTVRIIPLGGVEEIGRNMTAVEFGDDIFILDCGFAFSEGETPGIDYILPNTGYLEERREKIRGLLISHGHLDGEPSAEEKREFGVFKNRKVLALLMDSTNVWQPGFSIPESVVYTTLEKIIKDSKGRLVIAMFASHLERLIRVVHFAEEYGKKIVIDGRSMRTNIEIAREIGLIKYKDDTVVAVENMGQYPSEKLIILATGAQGDEFASLARIGNKTHKYIRLQPTDTVVLSSSVIPGNERAVQKLKDNLSRQGAHIITYHASDVHASGHGNREEAAWIHRQIKPKFFVPVHGYHYMLRVHADLAIEMGVKPGNVCVPDNSSIIEITGGEKITKLSVKAPSELRVVEGHTVSELSDVLMRDRKALGQEGFCVVVATVDRRTGKLHKSPDIISRGFVYLRDNKDLMDQTRLIIRKSVEGSMHNPRMADLDAAREDLAEAVARFLLQRTMKRPIVIPVIVSI